MIKRLLLFVVAAVAVPAIAQSVVPNTMTGTLTALKNPPPDGAGLPFLLTDGTVLVQGSNWSDWWKLTPDINGSYLNGTWKQMASLPSGYAPDAFASAVLANGKVVIVGGEYNSGSFVLTNLGAVYNPISNHWTPLAPPAGWDFIGDSPSAVLPNGMFLIGRKLDMKMAELNPTTLTWTAVASTGKNDWFAEEGFTLLPNGNVLTFDVLDNPYSEHYVPSMQQWVQDGSTVADLQGPPQEGCIPYGNGQLYCPPGEVGPAILRPNGTVFATGALHSGAITGHTAIYTPGSTPTSAGTWVAGPNFPNDDAGDNFAVLLPSGNVLVEGNSGRLYEFDGTNLVAGPYANGGSLITLPTGEVLVGGSEIYKANGTYQPSWAPTISTVSATLTRGNSYLITGTQFNGMSQAAAFGDEFETATNYPVVRLTNIATGHVFYARTHGHSTMGVQTGSMVTKTHFDVAKTLESGPTTLEVVANGIPSAKKTVTVQ